MNKVVIAQKTDERVLELLRPHAQLAFVKEGDPEDLKRQLTDACAVILGTWVKFGKDFIDAAPNLKVISRTGVGVDNVDVNYATSKKILVLNTPLANAMSVAEHTVALLCALSKFLVYLDSNVRKGNFAARRQYLPVDLHGKTLGLIGCGGIGRQVAEKCRAAFGMQVIGYDPFLQQAPEGIALRKTMDEVFSEADYLSLHIPLTPETRHAVDDRLLRLMKPSAFLVNTSRGGTVDETALCAALEQGRLAGAALDVFEQEPLAPENPLCALPNVILTPHSAALTQECVVRVAECAAQGVVDYLCGRKPAFIYTNPQS